MTLEDLGYNDKWEQYRISLNYDSFGVGRVVSEHKERYIVKTAEKEYEGEIIGNLRYTAQKRSDYPAVGDWVAISAFDGDKVLIHAVFPRETIIEREAVGKQGEKQMIAANIDYAFIVMAADRDFNINRVERYLTLCNTAKVTPIIILNKIDLVSDAELLKLTAALQERINKVPVICMSNEAHTGFDALKKQIRRGKTYCLLGSSGVGKSTLINNLTGKQIMKTKPVSNSSHKGQHVTSHRQLHLLEDGGILIDNPGMREVGIGEAAEGLEMTFDSIAQLSERCRFKDCTHTSEVDCAVMAAVESGELGRTSYENYLKMEKEREHFESSIVERRRKDKTFGKMVKHYKNIKNSKKQ
jgi:ribosome biogenesis GTPase